MESLKHLSSFLGSIAISLPSEISYSIHNHSETATLITLKANQKLEPQQTSYEKPPYYIAFTPSRSPNAESLHFLAFQTAEFAYPTRAHDVSLNFNFFSRPGFHRPHTVAPVWIFDKKERKCLLLAPINSFHSQVIAVDGDTFKWGWSGDLATIESDSCPSLVCVESESPREAMSEWVKIITALSDDEIVRPRNLRYADVTLSKLSYWTDNGSAYWYRRERGSDLPTTLVNTITVLEDDDIPIAAVEIDSWFYPHEQTRQITDVGYLDIVPPTGLLRWEPREDVLGSSGVVGLHKRLGKRPLILHSRHISSSSSYVNEPGFGKWWIDGDRAHPQDSSKLWGVLMQQAADWGAVAYEQDWLVEMWMGVRALREAEGNIEKWQKAIDTAAHERGLSLIWCMATPADMMQALHLRKVVAMRSCDDYRYAEDPSILWRWHLTTSSMLRELGFLPYKDVFLSGDSPTGLVDIDGDPHATLEACLATMSAGPVGIGDRFQRTNRLIVMKCCRADGVLIKPDVPLAAMDRSLWNHDGLLWAESRSGPWRYVMAIRTGVHGDGSDDELKEKISLGGTFLVYAWHTEQAFTTDELEASLVLHRWMLWVVCPIFESRGCEMALIGDQETFATMGDRRVRVDQETLAESGVTCAKLDGYIESDETHGSNRPGFLSDAGLPFHIVGAANEKVEVAYWSRMGGLKDVTVKIPPRGWAHITLQATQEKGIASLVCDSCVE